MALNVATGSLTISAVGQLPVTGLGFQPKVVIFWFGAGPGSVYWSFGVGSSNVANWCCSAHGLDAAGTSNAFSAGRSSLCIYLRDNSTVYANARIDTMDSDGFTLTVNASSGSQTFHYLALGGSDITNAAMGKTTVPASGATHAVTGLGFQPDLVLVSTVGQQVWDSTGDNYNISIGAMTAAAQFGCVAHSDDAQNFSSTSTYQLSDCVVPLPSGSTPTQFLKWSKSSLDSSGFTLSLDDLGTANADMGYLALKFTSPSWVKLGVETQPTSAQAKQTSGLGLTPSGLMFFGSMLAASTSPQNEASFCVGGWDGANQRSFAVCDEDNLNTSNADRRASTTKCIQRINGSASMQSEASVSASAYDSFTLDWSTADAVARQFGYLALGDPTAPAATFVPRTVMF